MVRSKVTLVKYVESHEDALRDMLITFSKEVYKSDIDTVDVKTFVECHSLVYIVEVNNLPIGFITYMKQDYFGLRKPTIAVNYTYLKKNYRKGRTTFSLAINQLEVAIANDLPLVHFYASKDSKMFFDRMEGTLLFNAYEFNLDTIRKQHDLLINKKNRRR